MKKVWEINLLEKGRMEFWDYYDLIEDSHSPEVALNSLAKKEYNDDSEFWILCAYLYREWEHDRKVPAGAILKYIKRAGGYEKFKCDRMKELYALIRKKTKPILAPNKNYKDFPKFTEFLAKTVIGDTN
jgi:hypothetical protein